MALVTFTALQFEAMNIVISQIVDAAARYEMIKDYNDEQCQLLINEALKTKKILDERLEGH